MRRRFIQIVPSKDGQTLNVSIPCSQRFAAFFSNRFLESKRSRILGLNLILGGRKYDDRVGLDGSRGIVRLQ